MQGRSDRRLLDELEQRETNRHVDLCLVVRHLDTKDTLLYAGGRWDRVEQKFTDEEPRAARFIDVHRGQADYIEWFATWLRDFREGFPRDTSLALAGGDRRGGKTFSLFLSQLCALVDVPNTIGWAVSVANTERDEIDRQVREVLPASWYVYREWPKHQATLINGSILTNVSADDPDTTKRGRVDIGFLNEPQKMQRRVLTNLIKGTADRGGLAILAANPPETSKGEWVFDLHEAIEEGKFQKNKPKYFNYDSRLNPFVDQEANDRAGEVLWIIDPKSAAANDKGIWRRPGEMAYEAFRRKVNVVPVPDLGDITAEFTKRKLGRAYSYIGGYDPNDRPHHAGTVWKVFGTLDAPILWAVDEIIVENADGEDHFLECVAAKYDKESIVWVMDNSCFFQDSKHQRNGKNSSDYFRSWGYRCEPNQPAAKNSKTGKPRNPPIELRVSLVNKLLYQSDDRLKLAAMFVSPNCVQLADSFKNCKSKKVRYGYGPVGREAHVTDTVGYVAWWVTPTPRKVATDDLPNGVMFQAESKGFLG